MARPPSPKASLPLPPAPPLPIQEEEATTATASPTAPPAGPSSPISPTQAWAQATLENRLPSAGHPLPTAIDPPTARIDGGINQPYASPTREPALTGPLLRHNWTDEDVGRLALRGAADFPFPLCVDMLLEKTMPLIGRKWTITEFGTHVRSAVEEEGSHNRRMLNVLMRHPMSPYMNLRVEAESALIRIVGLHYFLFVLAE